MLKQITKKKKIHKSLKHKQQKEEQNKLVQRKNILKYENFIETKTKKNKNYELIYN